MYNTYIPYIVWNGAVFLLYGLDKLKAATNRWRISEKTLIICAFFMGAFGAILGMRIFHHKTRKKEFRLYITAAAIVNMIIILLLGDKLLACA